MKHLLTALLLFLGVAKQSYAQLYTYYMDIPDNSIIMSVNKTGTTVTPIFSDPANNNIVDDYVVTHFCKAFPTSHYEYLQHVYKIQVNSTAMLPALRAFDSSLFPRYGLIDTVKYLSFTPGDWSTPQAFDLGYLDFIKARDAWDITHGDANVIIGVCDNYFDLNNPDLYGKIAYNGGNQMGDEVMLNDQQIQLGNIKLDTLRKHAIGSETVCSRQGHRLYSRHQMISC